MNLPGPDVAVIMQNSQGQWVLATQEGDVWVTLTMRGKVLQEAIEEATAVLCGDVPLRSWSVIPDVDLPGPAGWMAYYSKDDRPVEIF